MVNLYTGEYTAIVITPKHTRPPIDSLEQLWDKTNLKWVECSPMRSNFYLSNIFRNPNEAKARQWKCSPNHTMSDAPEIIALHPDDTVGIMTKEDLDVVSKVAQINGKPLIPKDGRKFYLSKSSYGIGYSAYYFSHRSAFKEAFNRGIMLMEDMYIRKMIERKFDLRSNVNANINRRESLDENLISSQLIRLRHFRGGLVLLGVGYSLAFLCFLWEKLGPRKIQIQ